MFRAEEELATPSFRPGHPERGAPEMVDAVAISIPSKTQDLIGQRFGRWTAVSFAGTVNGDAEWNCRCDCGTERSVRASRLKEGGSTSCGCSRCTHRVGRFEYVNLTPPIGRSLALAREQDPEFSSHVIELFAYCPNTGAITCKKTGRSRLCKIDKGYKGINVLFKKARHSIKAHRAAWLLHYERWPSSSLDHINGVKDDNRIVNLRESYGDSRNHANKNHQANSTTKIKGVLLVKTKGPVKFKAQIQVNHRKLYLGTFDTKEEAALAYNKAAIHYYGEFARLNADHGGPFAEDFVE